MVKNRMTNFLNNLKRSRPEEDHVLIEVKHLEAIHQAAASFYKLESQQAEQKKVYEQRLDRRQKELDKAKQEHKGFREQIQQERRLTEAKQREIDDLHDAVDLLEKKVKSEQQHMTQLEKKYNALLQQHNQDQAKYQSERTIRQQLEQEVKRLQQARRSKDVQLSIESASKSDSHAMDEWMSMQEPNSSSTWHTESEEEFMFVPATFYRSSHGGEMRGENGLIYFLPESMIRNYNLEHQAQVILKVKGDWVASMQLQFQGDDSDSSIVQLTGLLQQDGANWYCVPLTEPSKRYSIHVRDLSFHSISDGAPCVFNIDWAEPTPLARLSRVYEATVKAEEIAKEQRKRRPGAAKKKAKMEPFLTGTTVAVIGGARKWFEEVVRETGATFIHDEDQHISRIAARLTRANVICSLLTSVSHDSSTTALDIAREHEIPYFVIEGSKSYLRKLLWDQQDLIRRSNPTDEAKGSIES